MRSKKIFELSLIDDNQIKKVIEESNPKATIIPFSNVDIFEDREVKPFQCIDGVWFTGRWVGTVAIDNLEIEIIPRIGWERLVYLLECIFFLTYGASIEGSISLDEEVNKIIQQILIIFWLKSLQVGRQIHNGAVKGYIRRFERESLQYKGVLDVRQQLINQYMGKAHKIACRYSKLTYDIPLNRSFMFVFNFLKRYRLFPFLEGTSCLQFRQICVDWMRKFFELGVQVPDNFPEIKIKWDKTNGGYRRAYELAKIVAKNKKISQIKGYFQNILIDTAEVWELFTLYMLKYALRNSEYKVVSPRIDNLENKYLFEYQSRKFIKLIPDIVVYNSSVNSKNKEMIIVDAKYKDISNYKMPTSDDIKQMSMYSYGYKKDNFYLKKIIILYPKITNNDVNNKYKSFNQSLEDGYGFFSISQKVKLMWHFIDLTNIKNKDRFKILCEALKKAVDS